MLLTFSGIAIILIWVISRLPDRNFFHALAFRFLLKGISIIWSAISLRQNEKKMHSILNRKILHPELVPTKSRSKTQLKRCKVTLAEKNVVRLITMSYLV